MISCHFEELGEILGCGPELSPGTFRGIATDSRKAAPGQLFFAIAGDRFDGHEFVGDAVERGAVGAVVSRPTGSSVPEFLVNDVVQALGKVAGWHRRRFKIPVIGITGSCGKTTVKQMVAQIISSRAKVLRTQGNFNNLIGVPLTLAGLDVDHEFAVIEMGIDRQGEMAALTEIVRPTIGLVTNVAAVHLERLGTIDGVGEEKTVMYRSLTEDGVAVVNIDDPQLMRRRPSHCRVVTFSAAGNPEADIYCKSAQMNRDLTCNVTLVIDTEEVGVHLSTLGIHNVSNAVAAAACAWAADLDLEAICFGLARVESVDRRMIRKAGYGGAQVIDDSYNANPFSVEAAMQTLALLPGERMFVLGDMAELGNISDDEHKRMGAVAKELGIELFCLGPKTASTAAAFGNSKIHSLEHDELIEKIKPRMTSKTTVMVKGSNNMNMNLVADGLTG